MGHMGSVGGEGLSSGRGKRERGRRPLPGGIGRLVSMFTYLFFLVQFIFVVTQEGDISVGPTSFYFELLVTICKRGLVYLCT